VASCSKNPSLPFWTASATSARHWRPSSASSSVSARRCLRRANQTSSAFACRLLLPTTHASLFQPTRRIRKFNMPLAFDYASSLWPTTPVEKFFPDLTIQHCQQTGGSCVATGLSLLTRQPPETVRQHINTQNPVSWSHYLQSHGMKLAYCPTDLRRLRFYRGRIVGTR